MENMMDGIVMKGIGGFYYVETANRLYECKARGIFRKEGKSPLPGDRVRIQVEDAQKALGTLVEIAKRKNALIRPAMANLDQLFIVSSMCDPDLNLFLIDKIVAVAEDKEIEPVVLITKKDLENSQQVEDIYRCAGIPCYSFSLEESDFLPVLKQRLNGKISAFTGNSGVGKSTLLNRLFPELQLATGNISQKLGRGRHTTRQVELFPVEGGYIADTPGFSSMDLERYEVVKKENLPFCFREFAPYLDSCKFASCSHTCEKGCAVLQAVEAGEITSSRHASYVAMYNEVKNIKEWERK